MSNSYCSCLEGTDLKFEFDFGDGHKETVEGVTFRNPITGMSEVQASSQHRYILESTSNGSKLI